jgi:hypothetical protein
LRAIEREVLQAQGTDSTAAIRERKPVSPASVSGASALDGSRHICESGIFAISGIG